MPKFLAGCHYNEEEISWHLKKYKGYWPVQINGNKFATGKILGKLVEVVKGQIYLVELKGLPNPAPQGWLHFFTLPSKHTSQCFEYGGDLENDRH
jgi:hypothetical protein